MWIGRLGEQRLLPWGERSWSALHGAVPCITASVNNTTDPVGISGMTTHEAFSGASWIWRGSLKLLLWLPGMHQNPPWAGPASARLQAATTNPS